MKSDDVINSVGKVIADNMPMITRILQLKGGWEAWLQVEAAFQLLKDLGEGAAAAREQNYPAPDNARRADIYLKPAKGADIYVELKVQNAPNDNILTRFLADVGKIKGLNANTQKACVLVALGFVHAAAGSALKAVPKQVAPSSAVRIYQWDSDNTRWVDVTAEPKDNLRTLIVYKLT
jgi:hypothetical protein